MSNVITRPSEIDFDAMLEGDETPVEVSEFEYFTREAEKEGSKLVMIYDCEGQEIAIAPIRTARWLIRLMNAATSGNERALLRYEDWRWAIAKEFYGSNWALAIVECDEAHINGDCPLCGAMD